MLGTYVIVTFDRTSLKGPEGAHDHATSPPQAGGAPLAAAPSSRGWCPSSAAALICQRRYDVVIVGAGGAGMRRGRGGSRIAYRRC